MKEGVFYMFISSFIALFPVTNPIGSGLIINGFLAGLEQSARKSVIRRIILNYLLIGIGSLAIGHLVLSLFDLSLPIVQLGGGLLICQTALQWLGNSDSTVSSPTDKAADPISLRKAVESQVFYPITFPVSIGPGSISVIFTLMASASIRGNLGRSILNYAIIALVIALMCLILYLILSPGQRIIRKIGVTATQVINKMVAFFTFCVGIQIIASGIAKLFHLTML